MVAGFNEILPVKGSGWGIKRILRVDKAYLEKYDLSLSGIKKDSRENLYKHFLSCSERLLRIS